MSLAVALQTYQTTYVWTLTEIEVWYVGPVPGAEMSSWSICTERHTLTSCQVIFHQPPFGAVDVQADLLSPHVEGSHQVSVDWQSLVCANSTVWNLLCCPTEGHLVPNFTVLCFPWFFLCVFCVKSLTSDQGTVSGFCFLEISTGQEVLSQTQSQLSMTTPWTGLAKCWVLGKIMGLGM